MEKFALLFRGGRSEELPELKGSHMQKWFEWVNKLKSDGKYLSGEPLLPGGKQISGTGKIVTDGPFTESKDMIGGFFIVQVANYAEAIKICDDYPDFNFGGTVEIRKVPTM
ncbi:MAG: hypothetical protein HOP08_14300 [Cyclobacteriaceae bacterium]|nr:hypothetical protein [Cyclobacteriaceae bacterium]